jgi:3-hydroxy-9,10-secoandrosta-1,3,5(10)-triene-9,17-dione monooxygenase reductase component
LQLEKRQMSFDTRTFRDALGLFVTGVTVITTRDPDGRPVGITANSFNSVSLDPPLVLWSLARQSRSLVAFEQADHFAVHILRIDQQDLSDQFATSMTDKFAGLDPLTGLGGIPLLKDYAARLQCRIYGRHPAGDHIVFIAEVERLDLNRTARPLVYHGGHYAKLADMPPTG